MKYKIGNRVIIKNTNSLPDYYIYETGTIQDICENSDCPYCITPDNNELSQIMLQENEIELLETPSSLSQLKQLQYDYKSMCESVNYEPTMSTKYLENCIDLIIAILDTRYNNSWQTIEILL